MSRYGKGGRPKPANGLDKLVLWIVGLAVLIAVIVVCM